jgi:tetratricopeptide (TPR) repeat protein
MARRVYSLIISLLIGLSLYSQTTYEDSIIVKLSEARSDTTRVFLLNALGGRLHEKFPDSTFSMASRALVLAEKNNYKSGMAQALNLMGLCDQINRKYDSAREYFLRSLELFTEMKRKPEIAMLYNNLGLNYVYKNDPPKALEYYFLALKIHKEANDQSGLATVNGNIGLIYYAEGNYEKALEFFNTALELDEKLKNNYGIQRHTLNIGNVYYRRAIQKKQQKKGKEAADLFSLGEKSMNTSLSIAEKRKDTSAMANAIGNLANLYAELNDTARTILYYKKALKIQEERKDSIGVATQLGNMGWIFFEMKNNKAAIEYTKRAIELIRNSNELGFIYNWYDNLTAMYEESGDIQSAYNAYKQMIIYKDSLYSIDKAKKTLENQLNFEFEKKEALAKEEQAKQAVIRNAFIAGFALMLIMAIIVYRGYRNKQKANKEISEQKELLEIKNKEITDSIKYAKRIQNAHMPSSEYISKKLNELKKL